jgi:hypothetical protein
MDKDIKTLPKIDFTPVQTKVAEGKKGEKKKYLDEYYSDKFLKDYFNN